MKCKVAQLLSMATVPVSQTTPQLHNPFSIAINSEAKCLYISDCGADTVFKASAVNFETASCALSVFCEFTKPAGLAIHSGKLYVVSSVHQAVTVFSLSNAAPLVSLLVSSNGTLHSIVVTDRKIYISDFASMVL